MKRRIFGLETEYGITRAQHGACEPLDDETVRYMVDGSLSGAAPPDRFLENGGRFYLDTGLHPEYATPECDDLHQLVAYDRAGELILTDGLRRGQERLEALGLPGRIAMFKNNTDFGGHSYGCHENYLVPRHLALDRICSALIPFLVTRQVFAGAGHLVRGPKGGARYHLSQRALHICHVVAGTTTSARPIINTRDETLADAERFRRLHVIVGDSNRSDVATYLKVGATTMVLDMVEDDFFRTPPVLRSPVQALHQVSGDPALHALVELEDGRVVTGLDVQRLYLEACAAYAEQVGADAVTRDVLDRWSDVLDRLSTDARTAMSEVDWVMKKELIDSYRLRHGLSTSDPRLSMFDVQYHEISVNAGLYGRLIRSGAVSRLVGDAAAEYAKHHPPPTTRARLRGDFIRRARLRQRPYEVDWGSVRLKDPGSELVLCTDPFLAHDERVERLVA